MEPVLQRSFSSLLFFFFFLYSLLCYILMLRLQWVSIPLDGCMWEMREDVKRSIQSPFWMHSTTSFSRKPSSPFLFFSLSFHHLFWLFGSHRNDYKGKGGCYFREKAKILFGQIIHFCVTNFCLISGMLQLSRSILSRTWPDPFSEYSFLLMFSLPVSVRIDIADIR